METGITNKEDPFTVSELTEHIKTIIEASFGILSLKGEISDYKQHSSGHHYFTLKDDHAQISAVMFRGSAVSLSFAPKNGMMVQVKGKLSVYKDRGIYQIVVSSMIEAGIGQIMAMIEERKRRFKAEGLFDDARKKELPFFPETIGIVTSPNAAALRDILNIRRRRNDKINIVILPSAVQGEKAASEIAHMIRIANKYKMCDVLIVGRGGGSPEDLLPFSEEIVVRAIYDSEIPVVSSVGHEIDYALSDFVADVRAPTPSAAAEITIPLKNEIEERIEAGKQFLFEGITSKINSHRQNMRIFDPENMKMRLQNIEQRYSERFDRAFESIKISMENHIREKRTKIELYLQNLENCNPQTVFDRGYSMVLDESGKIIKNAKGISSGAKIKIQPAKGLIFATVDKTN